MEANPNAPRIDWHVKFDLAPALRSCIMENKDSILSVELKSDWKKF
jgi:hypothetical protein